MQCTGTKHSDWAEWKHQEMLLASKRRIFMQNELQVKLLVTTEGLTFSRHCAYLDHTHTHTHTYTTTHTRKHTLHLHIHCINTQTHTHRRTHTDAHTTHTHTQVCTHASTHTHTQTTHTHAHTHTHTHTHAHTPGSHSLQVDPPRTECHWAHMGASFVREIPMTTPK